MTKLEKLALELAAVAPKKRNRFSRAAYIPWAVVEEVRAEAERLGFDWKAACDRHAQLKRHGARLAVSASKKELKNV